MRKIIVILLLMTLICCKGKMSPEKIDRDINRIIMDTKRTNEDKYIYLWSTGLTLAESGEIESAEKY